MSSEEIEKLKETPIIDMILSGGGVVLFLERDEHQDSITIEILENQE